MQPICVLNGCVSFVNEQDWSIIVFLGYDNVTAESVIVLEPYDTLLWVWVTSLFLSAVV